MDPASAKNGYTLAKMTSLPKLPEHRRSTVFEKISPYMDS